MAQFERLRRVFQVDSVQLPDPDPSGLWPPERVKSFYNPNFGGVLNIAVTKGPTISPDGKLMIYKFVKPEKIGLKG